MTCRFAHDLAAGGMAFQRLTEHLDSDEFADIWDRVRLLYDVLCPATETKTHETE